MTAPPMEMVPAEAFSNPAINRSKVDLPEPDGPTKTSNSPASRLRVTSRTAQNSLRFEVLKILERCSISSRAMQIKSQMPCDGCRVQSAKGSVLNYDTSLASRTPSEHWRFSFENQ